MRMRKGRYEVGRIDMRRRGRDRGGGARADASEGNDGGAAGWRQKVSAPCLLGPYFNALLRGLTEGSVSAMSCSSFPPPELPCMRG